MTYLLELSEEQAEVCKNECPELLTIALLLDGGLAFYWCSILKPMIFTLLRLSAQLAPSQRHDL